MDKTGVKCTVPILEDIDSKTALDTALDMQDYGLADGILVGI
jgi:hypothetical protein